MPTADIRTILDHIPHRYPFLLVDCMIACEPGKSVRVLKNVTINEPFFQGHFPGRPVMPGPLVVEAVAQACGILCFYSGMLKPNRRSRMFFAGIDNCRFTRDVVPGDVLALECEMRRAVRGIVKFRGRALVDGGLAAEADLIAVIQHLDGDSAQDPPAQAEAPLPPVAAPT